MNFIKKNLIILVAFSLPILLIAIVALSTYLPSLFISTDYNFIYAVCDDNDRYNNYYDCNNYLSQKYSVVDNKLVESIDISVILPDNVQKTETPNYKARIFLHNTEKNESHEITLAEAQTLRLDELLTSPDGVTVSSYYDRGTDIFPIFNGNSSYGYYLTKGKSKNKLNLINSDDRYYYRDNFYFIGWLIHSRI